MKIFAFDTETSDKWDFKSPATAPHQPGIVQLAGILWDVEESTCNFKKVGEFSCLIKPGDGYTEIQPGAAAVHKIDIGLAERCGVKLKVAMGIFRAYLAQADYACCHNYQFDSKLVAASFEKCGYENALIGVQKVCTMTHPESMRLVGIPGFKGQYKWPSLIELHNKLFDEDFADAHDAMGDIIATSRCLAELMKRKLICL